MTSEHENEARRTDLPEGFVDALREALTDGSVITDVDDLEPYLREERGLFAGKAQVVVTPATTEELASAVAICAEAGVGMVPQGGNTGLVGGSVSNAGEIVVSMKRMNAIREVDAVNFTATVEAGAVLADIQKAAADAGCLFPLSLGAEGSCTIGGNIASNAGGIGVLRYGNTRQLTLGLEVVLPDGRVWDGMRPLWKDNSGYSLKDVFIGSEGSLGFVTAAVVKLFPEPKEMQTAFCALPSPAAALSLLSLARKRSGDQVAAFELLSDFACGIVCEHAGGVFPLGERRPWYALIELSSSRENSDLREVFEGILAEAFEEGLVEDAVLAESLDQRERLWVLRERTPEAQKKAGGSIKHDISVPVGSVPAFIEKASAAVEDYMPGINVCAFGHVGDGNIHFNMTQPEGMEKAAFLGHWERVNDIVHPIARDFKGSISAEHGIGLLKVKEIKDYRSAVEEDLNARIKRAIDPQNLMNPEKFI
ncbi:FAD-binding oxidoreductase [Pararhizobium mangrovi]|uniref:FAD-binding oxidoreductase n=1 Tax=Pararhizobium mangrovi TaxID=2590452 RepID=A0A506UA17_9HYPH|nr:FAD-binding oxidoreductase [Pararhizobium mangrovi]TPW30378.1 FAD-binding oxidoreductase [Pararhizobium mangrovi]